MRTDIMIGYPTATDEEEFEAIEYVGELFDEVAVHAFEVFRHARIAKNGTEFYPQEEVDRRLDRALRALQRYPDLLIHRGGQVYVVRQAVRRARALRTQNSVRRSDKR